MWFVSLPWEVVWRDLKISTHQSFLLPLVYTAYQKNMSFSLWDSAQLQSRQLFFSLLWKGLANLTLRLQNSSAWIRNQFMSPKLWDVEDIYFDLRFIHLLQIFLGKLYCVRQCLGFRKHNRSKAEKNSCPHRIYILVT